MSEDHRIHPIERRGARGVTLIEMMIVITITGIIVALAIPNLKPLRHTNKLSGRAEVIAGFLDDARRMAYNQGVCYRVRVNGAGELVIERRMHSVCTNVAFDDATDWDLSPRRNLDETGFEYEIKLSTDVLSGHIPGSDPPEAVIFRPNSRLWGDGDTDTTDDGVRVQITHTESGRVKSVDITPTGRICVKDWASAPAPTPSAALSCD